VENKIIINIRVEYIGKGKEAFPEIDDFFSKLKEMDKIEKVNITLGDYAITKIKK